MRIELHKLSLRRKRSSIIQTIKINGGSLDRPQIDLSRIGPNIQCARCGVELGRIVNRGAPCRKCKFKVCKACRKFTKATTTNIYRPTIRLIDDWICVVCNRKQTWVLTFFKSKKSVSLYFLISASAVIFCYMYVLNFFYLKCIFICQLPNKKLLTVLDDFFSNK